jgi:hypothetical protein
VTRWAWIPGFVGRYQVSDEGDLRSYLKKRHPEFRRRTPIPMRASPPQCLVVLIDDEGHKSSGSLSRFVLTTFAGEPPSDRHDCFHLNLDRSDNRLTNLEWRLREEAWEIERCRHRLAWMLAYAVMPQWVVTLHISYRKRRERLRRERRRQAGNPVQRGRGSLESRRRHERKRRLRAFGMSIGDYALMLQAQGGVCAICGQDETRTVQGRVIRLAVDHSHTHGHVRGLLCAGCNLALGHFESKGVSIEMAVRYLEDREPPPTRSKEAS